VSRYWPGVAQEGSRKLRFPNYVTSQDGGKVVSLTHRPLFTSQEIRGLLEKYPTFGREKETGLLGALDT